MTSKQIEPATDAVGCLHDVMSASTGPDGMSIVLYYGRSVTKEDRQRLLDAHNSTVLAREQAVRECAEKLDECRADILGKQDGREPAVDTNLRLMAIALDVAHDAILALLPTPPLIDRGSK